MGAGLSGLTAAYRLAEVDVEVVVLEARLAVGGRARRLDFPDGRSFEAGCEALDHAHARLLALAAELGVTVRQGTPWLAGLAPDLEADELALFRALDEEIERIAARLDPAHPLDAERAGELDSTSLADWLVERDASSRVLDAAETWHCVASAGVALVETSLLAQAGKAAAGAAPTGLSLRLDGGPSGLADRLAAELGDRIRLGADVVTIEDARRDVAVRLADGGRERAGHAIVAVPLTVQRRLRFSPQLPPHREVALERARYGEVVKAGLTYDALPPSERPALTRDGLVYEPEGEEAVVGVFAGAAAARRLDALDWAIRGREIGRLGGGSPRALVSVSWAREPFAGGSYVVFGPGDLTAWGHRLAEPHGRVHFAGAEASLLPSYMEGAIRAGERAAAEVLAAA